MKKRTQYIILLVTFIPIFLVSVYTNFRWFDRFMDFVAADSSHHDCFGLADESCQYESVKISCPFLSREKQSGLTTVTISNPHDIEQEYYARVEAVILEKHDKYRMESLCSEKLTIVPHQTGGFTCEADQRTVEGEIVWLEVTASPTDTNCAGTVYDTCSTQSLNKLNCLMPFIIAIPFLAGLIIISSRKEPAEPEPDSDPADA